MSQDTNEAWAASEHYRLDTDSHALPYDEEARVNALFGIATLAGELWEKGILGLVNHAVLHTYGYAIGVDATVPDEEGNRHVFGITLYRTADPDGIWFDEATLKIVREKMAKAGLR